jgi:hypothetical protein
MTHNHLRRPLLFACLLLAPAVFASPAFADFLTPGNIVVAHNGLLGRGIVHEITPTGQLVQQFSVEYQGTDTSRDVRGVTITPDGRIHLMQGTFDPQLTTIQPWDDARVATRIPGWSLQSNIYNGGIDSDRQGFIYLPNHNTTPEANRGALRLSPDLSEVARFGFGSEGVSVGHDGRAYTHSCGPCQSSPFVDAWDLDTFEHVLDLTLRPNATTQSSARTAYDITAWKNGAIYTTHANSVDRYSTDGVLADSLEPGTFGIYDLDLSDDGTIVAGSYAGILLTDLSLESFTLLSPAISAGSSTVRYVSFVPAPVPEPSALVQFALAAGLLIRWPRLVVQSPSWWRL